jgi:hypothetical protein
MTMNNQRDNDAVLCNVLFVFTITVLKTSFLLEILLALHARRIGKAIYLLENRLVLIAVGDKFLTDDGNRGQWILKNEIHPTVGNDLDLQVRGGVQMDNEGDREGIQDARQSRMMMMMMMMMMIYTDR